MSAHDGFADLKDFQRATVRHVTRRFFGPGATTRRFLVADEVGMGKTLVARGVIRETIERLRRPDSGIERIDIVYVCSNQGIAEQNVRKLDVLGIGTRPLSTRITMLATQVHDLNTPSPDGGKKINLVALTPGTSFQKGHAGGRVQERALLAILTEPVLHGQERRRALRLLLQMHVGRERWLRELQNAEALDPPPDRDIRERYLELLRASDTVQQLRACIDDLVGRRKVPEELTQERNRLVGDLRHLLATASVDALEPDLIILDEFQRFRQLMLAPDAEEASELNELANAMFEHADARVLLLSATPYKLFTLPEERALPEGDDHYRDFLDTVRFLAHDPAQPGHAEDVVQQLSAALAGFRDRLVSGEAPTADSDRAQEILRRYLCRTERPVGDAHDMRVERADGLAPPQADDLVSFARMQRLARAVEGELSVEYWKSAPYFLNFMDGYQLSERVRERITDPAVTPLLKNQRLLRRSTLDGRRTLDLGNPRLRALHADVAEAGLLKLLWLPPSMPYHAGAGPWASAEAPRATKRLIFSSWAAAPSSIAALLSHEALRSLEPTPAEHHTQRLQYAVKEGRPSGMTTLLLTLPQPGLAALCDPLAIARTAPESMLDVRTVRRRCTEAVRSRQPAPTTPHPGRGPETWYWHAPLTWDGGADPSTLLAVGVPLAEEAGTTGLAAHRERLEAARAGQIELGRQPTDLAELVALVGLASPANCAWRALRRVTRGHGAFSESALAEGAAMIAEGFRSLFNRSEVMSHLDATFGRGDQPYWQSVLEYCLAGNLQAVLDEHLHCALGDANPADDDALRTVCREIAATVAFDQGRVEAFDPHAPEEKLRIQTRFAVRFGNARGAVAANDETTARLADVRRAFNSPFWPFVLASTSVGQEGVDFHWWCHTLVHWNLPANVVDLEQREGRIHRFKGHAVRKNVAAAFRASALRSSLDDPWQAAFDAADGTRPEHMNELWPSWIYPGSAKIECWAPSLQLSRDIERAERLRRERGLYRLAFGQPRQEDLIELLAARPTAESLDWMIDLRPQSLD
ncbi:MAG: hypothetical protein V2J02_12060 [Pseudomonadales bacterium]|jgi:hypothetical protein|nr:hypothetical protein [Pseudomonadales bacterium]